MRHIDERRNVWVIAGFSDNGPAVAVADKDDRPAHGVDSGLRALLVVGVGGLGGLRHRHLVPIIHEDVSNRFPAGAIGESSMHQDHVLNKLGGSLLHSGRRNILCAGTLFGATCSGGLSIT